MTAKSEKWKKGRDKLDILQPLLGSWVATADLEMGKVKCTRTFTKGLDGNYIQLNSIWEFKQKRMRRLL